MTTRQKRRDQWRITKKGTWTCSLGHRGARVRLFQNRRGGQFYRDVYIPGRGRSRRSLQTCDKAVAERMGRELLAVQLTGALPRDELVRLDQLAEAFLGECPKFLDNSARNRRETQVRASIIASGFGPSLDVRKLTEHHVDQYAARRRAGGIVYADGKITGKVRQRAVQADVKLLKQMLAWAATRPTDGGGCWLDRNPISHVEAKGEADVRRPVATQERFEATLEAMRAFQRQYEAEAQLPGVSAKSRRRSERRRDSWIRGELALVLLEGTGRRRGSVNGLCWSDFDFATGRITWKAEYDKKGRTAVVPYPPELLSAVRDLQVKLGAVGGPLFPSDLDPERPAREENISRRVRQAEKAAGLPKLAGGTCHPYRRKWRSERAHLPIKAVAVAGGWIDLETMLRCYDQPDEAEVLAVTSEPRKRRAGVG